MGYAFGNSANAVIPYALAGAQVQTPHEGSGIVNAQAKLGALSGRSEIFGFQLEGGAKVLAKREPEWFPFFSSEVKLRLSRVFEVRTTYEYEFDHLGSLTLNAHL